MDVKDIIFYNEFTGFAEACNAKDMYKGRTIDTQKYGHYYTKEVATQLLLNNSFAFQQRGRSFNADAFLNGEFSNGNVERVIGEFVAVIREKNSTSITIDTYVRSNFNTDASYKVYQEKQYGRIEFKHAKGFSINGISGDAVIRLYDLPSWKTDEFTEEVFGCFALFVGLYLFVDLDGDWQSLDNLGNFVDKASDVQIKTVKDSIDGVKKVVEQSEKRLLIGQQELKQGQEKLYSKVSHIDNELQYLKKAIQDIDSSIKVYKEDIEEELGQCCNRAEEEELITRFSEKVVQKIMRKVEEAAETQTKVAPDTKNKIELDLKQQFGENWQKLDDGSQRLIITAKLLFEEIKRNETVDNPLDFSGVCILLTKALEVEMKNRFYVSFIDYLESKYPNNLMEWPYSLCEPGKGFGSSNLKPLKITKFTLGTVPFVCGFVVNRNIDEKTRIISEKRVIEYAIDRLFKDPNKANAIIKLKEIGKKTDYIKNKFRNPSAHTELMNQYDAKSCLDEMIYNTKSFVKILDVFK